MRNYAFAYPDGRHVDVRSKLETIRRMRADAASRAAVAAETVE